MTSNIPWWDPRNDYKYTARVLKYLSNETRKSPRKQNIRQLLRKYQHGDALQLTIRYHHSDTGRPLAVIDRYFYDLHSSEILKFTDPEYDAEEDFLNHSFNEVSSLQLLCKWFFIKKGIEYEKLVPPGLKNYLDIPLKLHFNNIQHEDDTYFRIYL